MTLRIELMFKNKVYRSLMVLMYDKLYDNVYVFENKFFTVLF